MSRHDVSEDLTTANRRLLSDVYAAAKDGDVAGVFSALSSEIVVREPAFLPYGGTYRGLEEFTALFGEATKFLDFSRMTVDGLVVDGDRGVALLRIPTTSGDGEVRIAELSIVRDGMVAEMEIFIRDTAGLVLG